jgi:glyoxylase-like metal-dependent hydrolase (beta-lactamase superfamily II)
MAARRRGGVSTTPAAVGVPPEKRLPGTWGADRLVVLVDGLRYRAPQHVHVLSHFHADHYGGLDATWPGGVVHVRRPARRGRT